MSPAGFYNNVARVWNIGSSGNVINSGVEYDSFVRIVISLEADTLVSGSGSIDDMWIVK